MLYFVVLMASTLWLQGVLGDERLTIGAVLLVMLVLPSLVRRFTGDAELTRRRYSRTTASPSGQNGSRAARSSTVVERHELAAHDLLGLEAERPVVRGAVDHAVHDGRAASAQRNGKSRSSGAVDAELLAQLARRAVVERLARGEHAADARVPVRRVDVLRRACAGGRRARRAR